MGKIIISENVSLDGVVQDPTGEEGTGRGSWFTRIADQDRAAWAEIEYEEALGAEALLMGRRTYAYFLGRGWASRTGEWADRLRSLPKYVVSSAALDGWGATTALAGIEEVAKLLLHARDLLRILSDGAFELRCAVLECLVTLFSIGNVFQGDQNGGFVARLGLDHPAV